MELRYTLEILTKDIQDIEKLVGNLQNSGRNSSIELDLALSKLRNVYEVLTLIKADRLQEMMFSASEGAKQNGEGDPQQQSVQASTLPDGPAEADSEETEVPSPPVSEPEDSVEEKPADEAIPVPDPHSKPPGEKGILGEKFAPESSINENLAGQRKGETDKRLLGQPIDNIHRNIGINDRFFIIRELFEGDADGFRELLEQLDEAGNFQKANDVLKQKFPESAEHEGIEILEGLIKRRFTTE
jgi:hypothetical protein